MEECNVVMLALPSTIRSFVRVIDDHPTIVLNSNLSWEMQQKCYKHEVQHLQHNDFEKTDVNSIEYYAHKGE